MNTLPNFLDLGLINPKRGDKYSPNLFRFLKKHRSLAQYGWVWKDPEGMRWLGYIHDGDFIGCRLMSALCGWGDVACYPQVQFVASLDVVKDFWPQYVAIGRCAIDPAHTEAFLSAENRFADRGDTRTCNWCGTQQYRQTKKRTVIETVWVNL